MSPTPDPSRPDDAIVIGAGVIGLSCAWEMARRGMRVRVLERDQPGCATSRVAAGMLAPVGEASWGMEALLELGMRSAAAYPRFVERVSADAGIEVPYRRRGALHLALDGDEAGELRRRHRLYLALGLQARELLPSECRRLEPGLAPGVGPGVLAADESEVDPRALLSALLKACETRGVAVESDSPVRGLVIEADRVVGVRGRDDYERRAGVVVVATGAWSAGSWLAGDVALAVRPVKGELVRLRAARGELPCEHLIVTERVYLVPREGGELVVGATSEERGFDTDVRAGAVHELLREAYRAVPEIGELQFIEAAAGLRPATPDNLPLIGRSELAGLLVATGHYRNGVLLAPVTADAVAALATETDPEADLAAFDPGRFSEVGAR